MQKGFMHELEENVLSDSDDAKVFLVPSKKEHLAVKIDKNILGRLKDDEKLEQMLKNLLKMNSKSTTKEVININKRNYRIFL
ncbi:hypothetical protein FC19_GL002103 [Liquorilactobacillus aquaticus DSM 21051]|uniref:Uncharacterized protein n=1 Tax=Liquorilactobacillus aquaticus DSM 21051 TaxID=1423725 RepID=A0A0R2D5T7_9LACO|nr:hypothetical protein [Liquorilactobacillus aquaticus]KRM95251.1 hypothetical protein FC19_GL002103 [Liquorilactobacillus aquaticus DSM 21051]